MRKLIGNRPLPFTRYWRAFTPGTDGRDARGDYSCDGFLPDPEGPYGKYSTVRLARFDDIAALRCAVLLGPPGQGKTIEVERWLDRARQKLAPEDAIFDVRGSAIGEARDLKDETVRSVKWQQARTAGGEITLVVDGLDEATQRSPVLLNSLIECLKCEHLEKTRVLLVSRVADWRESVAGRCLRDLKIVRRRRVAVKIKGASIFQRAVMRPCGILCSCRSP